MARYVSRDCVWAGLLDVGNKAAALQRHPDYELIVNCMKALADGQGAPEKTVRIYLPLHKRPSADLLRTALREMRPALDRVHAALQAGQRVLVHCYGGIERAPTFACAYLVRHQGMSCEEAIAHVIARRSCRPMRHIIARIRGAAACPQDDDDGITESDERGLRIR